VIVRALAALLLAPVAALAIADSSGTEGPMKETLEASIYRGTLVYQSYCVTCHGINADGKGRAAKLYYPKPTNLRTSNQNDAYKELIIRSGGKRLARSEYMPPWGEELTDEQIRDVVGYLKSIITL
jgi:mono/diheme cytochrome c family protein